MDINKNLNWFTEYRDEDGNLIANFNATYKYTNPSPFSNLQIQDSLKYSQNSEIINQEFATFLSDFLAKVEEIKNENK